MLLSSHLTIPLVSLSLETGKMFNQIQKQMNEFLQ